MKSKITKLISAWAYAFIFTLIWAACKKDESKPADQNSNAWGGSINLTISGKVIDDASGNPLAGVMVKAGTVSATTDNNGIFILKNAQGNSSMAFIQAEKEGYFSGSRSFLPTTGGGNLRIRLMPKIQTGTITAASGGQVSTVSGATLMLESGSVSKNGAAYTGSVKVFMQTIDPTSTDFESRMPGNLIAMDGNLVRGLKSFGMVAIQLQDDGGKELQIADGKKAHLKFPIPVSLTAQAADSIDLWFYDETKGYWKKEGRAGKEGNFYHGKVSHFSFWNCDVPYNFIELKSRILSGGQPLVGAQVIISSQVMGRCSDFTNSEGRFGGFVPKDEVLSLKVEAICGSGFTEVYSQNIGPFATNTSLNDISVNVPNASRVSGSITGCNNAAINGAYVVAGAQAYFTDGSGNYSFTACGSSSSLSLTAYGSNPWAQGSSQTISLGGGNVTVNLQVCGGGPGGTVTDIDGNVYNTKTIGTQVWMKENLKVSKYRNGDTIPTNLSGTLWQQTNSGACAVYNNDANNNPVYGKLYNWFTVTDSRGLCPTGWHVPSDAEWKTLESFLGVPPGELDVLAAGRGSAQNVGGKLKAVSSLWTSPNLGATDESGFSGLPGGGRYCNFSNFCAMGYYGYWWSSTESSSTDALYRNLYFNGAASFRDRYDKIYGLSVRCVKD